MLIPLFVSAPPPPAASPPAVVVKIGTPYIEERRTPLPAPASQPSKKAAKPSSRRG